MTAMPSHTLRRWSVLTIAPVITLVWWMSGRRAEVLADRLLRIGGRLVGRTLNRPGPVLITFAVLVLMMWLVIGVKCLLERGPHGVKVDAESDVSPGPSGTS